MKKILLYLITFLAGAVFLGLEIIASRVLAPYFGNSIYVWGALISVFLLALSVGYSLGGRVADLRPSFLPLAAVIFASGVWIMALPYYYLPVSGAIVELGWSSRPSILLACSVFFLFPSILMGMVSPYVVKLNTQKLTRVGQSAGSIFAVSTIGSVVGALGVSFYLIPLMGVKAILLLCGGILLGVSGVCVISHKLS